MLRVGATGAFRTGEIEVIKRKHRYPQALSF
jgi:hypothetical protein